MKYSNLFFCIVFAALSLTAMVYTVLSKRTEILCLGIIFAGIAYAAWQDFKNPQ